MRKGMWKETAKRLASIFLAGMILAATVVTPVSAVHTYYWPDAVTADAMAIKNWTWTAEGEEAARNPSVGLVPTGLSQQETALMGGYTSKFWFQAEKAKTITIPGTSAELPVRTVIIPDFLRLWGRRLPSRRCIIPPTAWEIIRIF